jgi:argininosuccinate lyase
MWRRRVSELLRKGRLSSARKDVVKFTSSVIDDEKILKHIIDINKAHVVMLVESNIINKNEGSKILGALTSLGGKINLSPDMEDGHMAVEEEVIKAIGSDVGGNLNLAKSRNDQVAAAIRMELRDEIIGFVETTVELQEALVQQAKQHIETVIPGYTHLQPAQPVTFAHYLIAQYDALQRSLDRLRENFKRVDLCPMGAGALATTSFKIDRERVADLLGFEEVLENSIDAVSTRDFLLETLANLTILAVDVTRFVEDLIIWSTMEFGIVELTDEFAFTSSIMPQKKNPDVLEVIRARMSLASGIFTGSATALMALPSTYNMDFQEVTPKLWQTLETVKTCLSMLTEITPNLTVKKNALGKPALTFLMATELANMLVRNYKIPFRTSHRIVGATVKTLLAEGKSLRDVTPEVMAEVSKRILGYALVAKAQEIRDVIEPSHVVKAHCIRGGPSPKEVKRMIDARVETIAQSRVWISERKRELTKARKTLKNSIAEIMNPKQLVQPNRNA